MESLFCVFIFLSLRVPAMPVYREGQEAKFVCVDNFGQKPGNST